MGAKEIERRAEEVGTKGQRDDEVDSSQTGQQRDDVVIANKVLTSFCPFIVCPSPSIWPHRATILD